MQAEYWEIRAGIEPAYAVLQTALWAARVPDQRLVKFVGTDRIELSASSLSEKRSTSELRAPEIFDIDKRSSWDNTDFNLSADRGLVCSYPVKVDLRL